jgi:hypothetical protein
MRPRPALPSHRGAQYGFSLDTGLTHALHEFTQQRGVTLFSTPESGPDSLNQDGDSVEMALDRQLIAA